MDRCRSTVHNWLKKAGLEPRGGRRPEEMALDETIIKIGGERFWFFAAVDPGTNRFLHVGLSSYRATVSTKLFLRESQQKHGVEDAEFPGLGELSDHVANP